MTQIAVAGAAIDFGATRAAARRHLHRDPRREVGRHRPERKRQDLALPPAHRGPGARRGQRGAERGAAVQPAGAAPRPSPGPRPCGRRPRARSPICSPSSDRWRSREPPSPRRATVALRRCSPDTTATSSASSGRTATASPRASMRFSMASVSTPTRRAPRPLDGLSGGERGRLGLARQLVTPADVLLLDEPTNHLDLETSRWLEDYLRGVDETVLLVSHDRAFLQAVVDHVLHLEAGSAVAYTGDYEAFLRQRAERRLAQRRAYHQAGTGDRGGRGLSSAGTSRARTARRPRDGGGGWSGSADSARRPARRAPWRSGSRPTSAAATRCWPRTPCGWPLATGSCSSRLQRHDPPG